MNGLRDALIENLKRLRAERGWSQAALAERTGLSTGHIGEIETGNRFPSPEVLEKLAAAFGIRAVSLLMAEEELRLLDEARTLAGFSDQLADTLSDRLSERIVSAILEGVNKTQGT